MTWMVRGGGAEGGEGDSAVGIDSSGRRATRIDISDEGDSSVLLVCWFPNDSDTDHISVADSGVSFEVEGSTGGGLSWADDHDGRSRHGTDTSYVRTVRTASSSITGEHS